MLSIDAEKIAWELIRQHVPGWVFQFDRGSRRCGCCHYRGCIISLSLQYVQLNSVESVRNTILHEIAHAIAGSAAGHGWQWQQACLRIGAKPERLNSEAVMIYNVYADCACGHEVHKKMKMPSTTRICLRCKQVLVWKRK